jgi:hypothetical protein
MIITRLSDGACNIKYIPDMHHVFARATGHMHDAISIMRKPDAGHGNAS